MDIEFEQSVPTKIKTVLHQLVQTGVIGLSRMKKLRVTSNNNNGSKNNSHSYLLEIPYAGTHLNWEVTFSNENLSFAPDFDFINDQFLTDPDINVIEKDLPSLDMWNIDDPMCLYNVIKEILLLYGKYQADKLQVNKYNRQFNEYLLLVGELQIPESDVEVLIDQCDYVHFLINLPINISMLPPYLGKYFEGSGDMPNPGGAAITVRISYMNVNKVQTMVWLSPHLEEVIGGAKQLHGVPMYNKDVGLIEYLSALRKVIGARLEAISANYKRRNEFVSTMLAYQGQSIIEYDNVTFTKMTLLLEAHDNHCLVAIQLGARESNAMEKPQVLLRSLHSERNNKPITEHLSYPYSNSLSIEDVVKRILNSVYFFLSNYKPVVFNNSHNETKSYAGVVK